MAKNNLMATLGHTDLKLLQGVVEQIDAVTPIKIIKAANSSLVMMGVKDSVQEVPFYLGEVLITECAVAVNDSIGYGFAMGADPERAYCLAVIEAVLQEPHGCGEHLKKPLVEDLIANQAEIIHHAKARDEAAINQTRVKFDSMQEVSG